MNRPQATLAAIATAGLVLTACNGDTTDDPTATSTCLTVTCEENTLAVTTATPTPAATPEPTSSPTPTPSPSTTPTPTSPPTVAGEWVAPDPLTDEYVKLVTNELFALEVDIVQPLIDRAAAGNEPIVEDIEGLNEQYQRTRSPVSAAVSASTFTENDAATIVAAVQNPVGSRVVTDVELIESGPECIVAKVVVDSSSVLTSVTKENSQVQLRKPAEGVGNPTGWILDGVGPVDGPAYQC